MINLAGGTWSVQNKIRPGAYLNFMSVPRPQITVSDRGIGIIPLELNWGAEGELIEVISDEMITGASLHKVGFTAFDEESKVLNLMLQNCYKSLVFRLNTGGIKASTTIGGLTVTAKYSGTFGNKIQISIVKLLNDSFEVKTFVNSALQDTQVVLAASELVDNNFVVFGKSGMLDEVAGEPLIGGTNGILQETTAYSEFLKLASVAKWQTMAIPKKSDTTSAIVSTFIKDQRDNKGRYVQAVLCDYSADHEGIINSINGVIMNSQTITPEEFTAWVAGITAGANINTSNTARIVQGATSISGELDNEGIINALRAGQFVLSRNQDGAIKVEQDINSFTSFTQNKNYAFSKNRLIRTFDEIGVSVKSTWERSYMGKVNNDENGRAIFKGDIIAYAESLQRLIGGAAIQEFSTEDVQVSQGDRLSDVRVDLRIKPVDSMEFLYMNVNIIA